MTAAADGDGRLRDHRVKAVGVGAAVEVEVAVALDVVDPDPLLAQAAQGGHDLAHFVGLVLGAADPDVEDVTEQHQATAAALGKGAQLLHEVVPGTAGTAEMGVGENRDRHRR